MPLTPSQLRACLHPLRLRLLEAVAHVPGSGQSLARRLSDRQPRVHYHLARLAEAGLVRVVEERRRRGMVERLFAADPGAWAEASALLAVARPAGEGYAAREERTLLLTRGQARHLHEDMLRLFRQYQAEGGRGGECRVSWAVTES